jgi:hypothetical protein
MSLNLTRVASLSVLPPSHDSIEEPASSSRNPIPKNRIQDILPEHQESRVRLRGPSATAVCVDDAVCGVNIQ